MDFSGFQSSALRIEIKEEEEPWEEQDLEIVERPLTFTPEDAIERFGSPVVSPDHPSDRKSKKNQRR
eukprot:1316975-Amorphochlora_amoeboformis.AAC.1